MLIIVGVVAGIAVLSIGHRDRAALLDEEVQRLSALIRLVREESILNGDNLGIGFGPAGYGFWRLAHNRWEPIGDEPVLRARALPPGVELELELERRSVALPQVREGPQVLALASGEMTPFRVRLALPGEGAEAALTVLANGEVQRDAPVTP